jgi:hypothetical protein
MKYTVILKNTKKHNNPMAYKLDYKLTMNYAMQISFEAGWFHRFYFEYRNCYQFEKEGRKLLSIDQTKSLNKK